MRKRLYRVAGLEVSRAGEGCTWRAWVVVNGKSVPVRGAVGAMGDFDTDLKARIAAVYESVTGLKLDDDAL
jgi:hypothetical protein